MANNLQNAATVEIPLSKNKLVLMLVGSVAFVAAGVWFVTHPDIRLFGNKTNPALAYIIGIAAIAFFGFCAWCLAPKLFDNKPGLVVSAEGITDNCSGFTFGLIPWADIEDINVLEMGKQKLIMILVSDPDEYINRQSNSIMKKMAKMNNSSYGTPISITANTLQYDVEELYSLLRGRLEARG